MTRTGETATVRAPARTDLLPSPHVVTDRVVESADTVTLRLRPLRDRLPAFRPGQFTMVYAYGVGEIPVSISGDPLLGDGLVLHTVRAVGAVSRAIQRCQPGSVLGLRGPYGTDWGLPSAVGQHLLLAAGGIGLAPLRPVVLEALAQRSRYRTITVIAGARTPTELLFGDQLRAWSDQGVQVLTTVDHPIPGWRGRVGLVTAPLAGLPLDPPHTIAFLCGPEPMMRACAQSLTGRGLAPDRIRLSLERTMRCGVGLCGHCQLGPLLVCRDGPVVSYSQAADLLAIREL